MSGRAPGIAGVLPGRIAEIEQKLGVVRVEVGDPTEFAQLLGRADAGLVATRPGSPAGGLLAATLRSAPGRLVGSSGTASPARATGAYGDPAPLTAPMSTAGPASRPGDAVVAEAARQIGVPYVWGGDDPTTGFDCSGLVQHAFDQLGVEMPRVSQDQARMGEEVAGLDRAQPGDLLAFGEPATHIAIYVGDGRMLHAPRTGETVKIEPIDRPITSIRRIVTAPATAIGGGADARPVAVPVAVPYADLFAAAGARHGVEPALLAAVAAVESAFDPDVVSHAGAIGLMQFMPGTAASYGIDPTDPAQAVDGAARYLRAAIDRFGSVELALAAYNAGPGAVTRYGGIPPYPETRAYVPKVLARYEDYR